MSFPPGNVFVTPFVGADDENDGAVAPPQGSGFFEDVEGDYYDNLQKRGGRGSHLSGLRRPPPPKLGGGMTDTALAMLMAGIAVSHLRMHLRELR